MTASTRNIVASPHSPTSSDLQRIAAGDKHACRSLIDRWETPIKIIASKIIASWDSSRPSDLDDLMQVGRLAVYQSALNYDASRQVPFGNYAKRAVKNCVVQEAVRLARQRKSEKPLEGHSKGVDEVSEEMADRAHRRSLVKKWAQDLPEPHATIFRLLYIEGLKQRPAAKQIGVSQPRVAQLHRSFLDIARVSLAGLGR